MSSMNKLLSRLNKEVSLLSKADNYDTEKYVYSLIHQTKNLRYFYTNLCKDREPDEAFYHLPFNITKGDIVYVNLERGFPKELMDGHWCYVHKVIGCKIFIIPLKSFREKSTCEYSLDVFTKINGVVDASSASLSDMRWVDIQRVHYKRGRGRLFSRSEQKYFEKKVNDFLIS